MDVDTLDGSNLEDSGIDTGPDNSNSALSFTLHEYQEAAQPNQDTSQVNLVNLQSDNNEMETEDQQLENGGDALVEEQDIFEENQDIERLAHQNQEAGQPINQDPPQVDNRQQADALVQEQDIDEEDADEEGDEPWAHLPSHPELIPQRLRNLRLLEEINHNDDVHVSMMKKIFEKI